MHFSVAFYHIAPLRSCSEVAKKTERKLSEGPLLPQIFDHGSRHHRRNASGGHVRSLGGCCRGWRDEWSGPWRPTRRQRAIRAHFFLDFSPSVGQIQEELRALLAAEEPKR